MSEKREQVDVSAHIARIDRELAEYHRARDLDRAENIGIDDDLRARRRALAGRELALREAEIESRIKELWWTPPRMITFCSAVGVLISLLGMGVAVLTHMLH
jgi:hypothetical protein